MISRLNALITTLVGILALALLSGPLHSEEWRNYELRTAQFAVPPDWQETFRQRDQEFDFQSADQRFELWVRWWFPDEPLLGYSDIVRHEKLMLAGEEALFIHVDSNSSRTLELAFLKPDAEGEQLLFQLIGNNVPLAEHEAMLDNLLQHLSVNGLPVDFRLSSAANGSAEILPLGASVAASVGAEGLSLPQPSGWLGQSTTQNGLYQVVRLSPDRDALVLAVAAENTGGTPAGALIDEFLGLLYRDTIVVKSIEGESYPDIAMTTTHRLQTIAKVFDFGGITLPYKRGQVDIYQGGDDGRTFLVVAIHAVDANPQLVAQVQEMVMGLSFGWGQRDGTNHSRRTCTDSGHNNHQHACAYPHRSGLASTA